MLNWRKCVAVAAVGAMLAVPVAAEAPGVHDLTDDELKALYMDVKQELMIGAYGKARRSRQACMWAAKICRLEHIHA